MAQTPRVLTTEGAWVRRYRRLEAEVGWLKRRLHEGGRFTEARTFIVPGPLTAGMPIPPMFVSENPRFGSDEGAFHDVGETRSIIGLCCRVQTGTANIAFMLNNSTLDTLPASTAQPGLWSQNGNGEVSDRDSVGIQVVASNQGFGLSATVAFLVVPGSAG